MATASPRGRKLARILRQIGTRPDLRTDKTLAVTVSPPVLAMVERLRRGDETNAALLRRLIADDLWRCPEGDLAHRALLLFLPGSQRGHTGKIYTYLTQEMYELAAERARLLTLTRQDYLAALIARADILLDHGVAIPADPEDLERVVAGMDIYLSRL